jgi:uncharacterized LabA/DUF88 family protein
MRSPGVYEIIIAPTAELSTSKKEKSVPLDASNLKWGPKAQDQPKQRVIFYVDGFNLYFGMKQSGWKRYYWLNVRRLAENLVLPNQELVGVYYFTSRISRPEDKRVRQNSYLEALEATDGLEVRYGQFYDQPFTCPICKGRDLVPAEKMTDVNIATQLMVDAFRDRFDAAFIVSADSDLVPPMKAILDLFPGKRIVAAFPPNRTSQEIKSIASAFFSVGKPKLAGSQFPDIVLRKDGFEIRRPTRWS